MLGRSFRAKTGTFAASGSAVAASQTVGAGSCAGSVESAAASWHGAVAEFSVELGGSVFAHACAANALWQSNSSKAVTNATSERDERVSTMLRIISEAGEPENEFSTVSVDRPVD